MKTKKEQAESALIDRVVILMRERALKQSAIEKNAPELTNMTFICAVLRLLKSNPYKKMEASGIKDALIRCGFKTKSKNFGRVVRTRLATMRKEGMVNYEKSTRGRMGIYKYYHKRL